MALNINYNGKSYKAEFDRATARQYAADGHKLQDVWENPLIAIVPFVYCAFKKNHPAISVKKAEEIYDALPKSKKSAFLTKLVESYGDAIKGLVGDAEAADGDEGNAVWENEDED